MRQTKKKKLLQERRTLAKIGLKYEVLPLEF